MSRTRIARAAATQRLLAESCSSDGWPFAKAAGAAVSDRDIGDTPGFAVELRGACRELDVICWLRQTVRNAGARRSGADLLPEQRGSSNVDEGSLSGRTSSCGGCFCLGGHNKLEEPNGSTVTEQVLPT